MWLFVILSFLWLGLEGKICRDHAPHIFALMILILSVIALHYALQCCIWVSSCGHLARALSDLRLLADLLRIRQWTLAACSFPSNSCGSGPHRARALHTPFCG